MFMTWEPYEPSHLDCDSCGVRNLVDEMKVIGNWNSHLICSECSFECEHCGRDDFEGEEVANKLLCSSCCEEAYVCEVCEIYIPPSDDKSEWYPYCSESCCDKDE